MLNFENQYYSKDIHYIAGVDEAGRGCWLGPVVAAAVIFAPEYTNPLIDDSKKLSAKRRAELYDVIINDALAVGIGIIEAEEIDKINILQASKKAMKIAINNLNYSYQLIISDATALDTTVKTIPVIKADAKCLNVAAASIIAKVTRDRICEKLDKKFPAYQIKDHKGYGTKEHMKALKKFGPIRGVHRFSYRPIKQLLMKKITLF